MKTTKIITLFTVIAITSIYFTSCKRNDIAKDGGLSLGPQATGTPTSLNFVEEQLRWIARGYAEVLDIHDPAMFSFLNTHLSNKADYQDDHLSIKNQCQAQTSIDLEMEVYHSIQRVPFYNNQYDRDYFYDFLFDDCNWSVGLRIVDTPDLSKPVVISYETFSGSDSSWGYFWNSGLDSVLLSSENFEDYYVFFVFAQNNCQYANRTLIDVGGCNNNKKCEYWYGEVDGVCPDCPEVKTNSNQKALKIVWVKINEDKAMFDEAWAQNQYELAWSWCIAQDTSGIINYYRKGDPEVELFSKFKRKEVPIKRKSNGSIKGNVTTKYYNNSNQPRLMYNLYDYLNHDIYLRFFESDKIGNNGVYSDVKTVNNEKINFSSSTNLTSFSNQWFTRLKGGTFHQGGSINPGGVIHVPANSTWNSEAINGKAHKTIEVTSPGLGEITVKLAYEE